jgi:O-antigen/teichoic acid export membrane protein
MRRYIDYPLYFLPSTLIDSLVVWLPLPLVLSLYGSESAGFVAMVMRILAVPIALIGASVADVFYARLTEIHRSQPGHESEFFFRTLRRLFLIGVGPAVIVATVSPVVLPVLLGHQWATCGVLASVLTPWFLAQFCVSPVSRTVLVMGGQRSKLIYDVSALGLSIGSYAIARQFSLSLTGFIGLLTAANCVAYAVYLLILVALVRKAS